MSYGAGGHQGFGFGAAQKAGGQGYQQYQNSYYGGGYNAFQSSSGSNVGGNRGNQAAMQLIAARDSYSQEELQSGAWVNLLAQAELALTQFHCEQTWQTRVRFTRCFPLFLHWAICSVR